MTGTDAKPHWLSKTFWTGAIVTLIGFLSYAQMLPFVYNNTAVASGLLVIVGILMILLRQMTNRPVTPMFQIPKIGSTKPPIPPDVNTPKPPWRKG